MTKRGAWKKLRPTEPPEKDTFKTVNQTDDCTVQVPRAATYAGVGFGDTTVFESSHLCAF